MCVCTCEKKLDENGCMSVVCERKGCNAPIIIREYQLEDNPLFCSECRYTLATMMAYYPKEENESECDRLQRLKLKLKYGN